MASRTPSVCAIVGTMRSGSATAARPTKKSVREVVEEFGCGLCSEPRLSGAAGSGERHQANATLPEESGDLADLPLAADKCRGLQGKIRRPVPEATQRWELGLEVGDKELVEPLRLREILQAVLAQVA